MRLESILLHKIKFICLINLVKKEDFSKTPISLNYDSLRVQASATKVQGLSYEK